MKLKVYLLPLLLVLAVSMQGQESNKSKLPKYIDTKILLEQTNSPFSPDFIITYLNTILNRNVMLPFYTKTNEKFILPAGDFSADFSAFDARAITPIINTLLLFRQDTANAYQLLRMECKYEGTGKDSAIDTVSVLVSKEHNEWLFYKDLRSPPYLRISDTASVRVYNFTEETLIVKLDYPFTNVFYNSDTLLLSEDNIIILYKRMPGLLRDTLNYPGLEKVRSFKFKGHFSLGADSEYDIDFGDYKVNIKSDLSAVSKRNAMYYIMYNIYSGKRHYQVCNFYAYSYRGSLKDFKMLLKKILPAFTLVKEIKTDYYPGKRNFNQSRYNGYHSREYPSYIMIEESGPSDWYYIEFGEAGENTFTPYSDSMENLIKLSKLFNNGIFFLKPDTVVNGLYAAKLSQSEFDYYRFYTNSKPDTYYIAPFDKQVFESLRGENKSLKLNKNLCQQYNYQFSGDFLIFKRTDSGFILHDYLYKGRIANNPENVQFIRELAAWNAKPESKPDSGYRVFWYGSAEVRAQRYRIGGEDYWLQTSVAMAYPYLKDSILYREHKVSKKLQREYHYRLAPTYTIEAFRDKEFGWAYLREGALGEKMAPHYVFPSYTGTFSERGVTIYKDTKDLKVAVTIGASHMDIDSTFSRRRNRTIVNVINDSISIGYTCTLDTFVNRFSECGQMVGFKEKFFINRQPFTGHFINLSLPFILYGKGMMDQHYDRILGDELIDSLSDDFRQRFSQYLHQDKRNIVRVSKFYQYRLGLQLDSVDIKSVSRFPFLVSSEYENGQLLSRKYINLKGEIIHSMFKSGDTVSDVMYFYADEKDGKILFRDFKSFYYKPDSGKLKVADLYRNFVPLYKQVEVKYKNGPVGTDIVSKVDNTNHIVGKSIETFNELSRETMIRTYLFWPDGEVDSADISSGPNGIKGIFYDKLKNAPTISGAVISGDIFCKLMIDEKRNYYSYLTFASNKDTLRLTEGGLDSIFLRELKENFSGSLFYYPENSILMHYTLDKTFYKNKLIARFETDTAGQFNILQGRYKNGKTYLVNYEMRRCVGCDSVWVRKKKNLYDKKKIDVFHYVYKLDYPNGRIMGITKPYNVLSGDILKMHCDDSIPFLRVNLEFREFYDSLGRKTFDGKNGHVQLMDGNKQPVYEAFYKNGQRDSIYRGYSDEGLLNEIGNYKDGKRDGLWYSGNLNGRFDWSGLCNASPEYVRNILSQDPFVSLVIVEYREGQQVNSYNINYKKQD